MTTRKKLASEKGESIAEALLAVLILAMGFIIVAGASGAATRVHEKVKEEEIVFDMDTVALVSDKATVSVSVSGPIADPPAPNAVVNVNLYKTVNGYYYYDVNEASESEDDDA